MLGGSLALILLIIIGFVIYKSVTTAPALEMWDAAMEDYRSGAYPQAMKRFEDFLDDYAEHDHANGRQAKARRRVRSVAMRFSPAAGRSTRSRPDSP